MGIVDSFRSVFAGKKKSAMADVGRMALADARGEKPRAADVAGFGETLALAGVTEAEFGRIVDEFKVYVGHLDRAKDKDALEMADLAAHRAILDHDKETEELIKSRRAENAALFNEWVAIHNRFVFARKNWHKAQAWANEPGNCELLGKLPLDLDAHTLYRAVSGEKMIYSDDAPALIVSGETFDREHHRRAELMQALTLQLHEEHKSAEAEWSAGVEKVNGRFFVKGTDKPAPLPPERPEPATWAEVRKRGLNRRPVESEATPA